MSENLPAVKDGPPQVDVPDTIFHEGCVQHWIREVGERDRRLVYRGELVEVNR